MQKHIPELHENNVRINFIGRRDRLKSELLRLMENAETLTAGNSALQVNVALDYGGQWDISQALKRFCKHQPDAELTPESLQHYLSLAGQPLPDLLIRTGGEQRISNFLLWQLAYAELYFSTTLWPDFNPDQLQLALDEFAQRDRRFGQLTGVVTDVPETTSSTVSKKSVANSSTSSVTALPRRA